MINHNRFGSEALLGRRVLELVEDFSPRMLCMSLLGLSAASGQMEDVKMLKVSSEKPFQSLSGAGWDLGKAESSRRRPIGGALPPGLRHGHVS